MSTTKMTKRYAKFRKNVNELMHKLTTLISFPEETPVPKPLIDEFKQQCSFARNLLSAELASAGAEIPRHLRRITYRLKCIDEIFRDWSAGFQFPEHDDRRRFLAADSECSCTDEDGGEIDGGDRPETEGLAIVAYDGKSGAEIEAERDQFKECLVTEIEDESEEKLLSPGGVRGKRSVWVFGLVFLVVVCFVVLVVFCFGCYVDRYHGDYSYNVLTPT